MQSRTYISIVGHGIAEIFRRVGNAAAGKANKFRMTGQFFYLLKKPLAYQHAQMTGMIFGMLTTFVLRHCHSPRIMFHKILSPSSDNNHYKNKDERMMEVVQM